MFALAAVDCRTATEIIVDVRTDGCDRVQNTSISVASPGTLTSAEPIAFSSGTGCERADRIGTLTLFPRDDNDAEVAVRIVTGVDKPAHECEADRSGCIVAQRRMRFVSGKRQTLLVIMSLACIGKDCGPDLECGPDGACVDPVRLLDGGGTRDGAVPRDSGVDAAVSDACATACSLPNQVCAGGTCTTRCSVPGDCNGELCAPDLACTILCDGQNACSNVSCSSGRSCAFSCTTGSSCGMVTCASPSCGVSCAAGSACGTVLVSALDAGVDCQGNGACGIVRCSGGRCILTCSPDNACPLVSSCDAAICDPPDRWDASL